MARRCLYYADFETTANGGGIALQGLQRGRVFASAERSFQTGYCRGLCTHPYGDVGLRHACPPARFEHRCKEHKLSLQCIVCSAHKGIIQRLLS